MATSAKVALSFGVQRSIKVSAAARGKVEALRHHANDRVWDAIQMDCLPNNVRSACKPLLPTGMTQNHEVPCPGEILARPKVSPQHWLHTQRMKEAIADPERRNRQRAGRRVEKSTATTVDFQ